MNETRGSSKPRTCREDAPGALKPIARLVKRYFPGPQAALPSTNVKLMPYRIVDSSEAPAPNAAVRSFVLSKTASAARAVGVGEAVNEIVGV